VDAGVDSLAAGELMSIYIYIYTNTYIYITYIYTYKPLTTCVYLLVFTPPPPQTVLVDAGVDSLAAGELMSRCAAQTGVALTLSHLEEFQTLRGLAKYVASAMRDSAGVRALYK